MIWLTIWHCSDATVWGVQHYVFFHASRHTWLTSTKRFTNLKVNLKHLGLYIGAKMQLVSYEFEYFYQCIMTFWDLRDSKGPILMHQAHLIQN